MPSTEHYSFDLLLSLPTNEHYRGIPFCPSDANFSVSMVAGRAINWRHIRAVPVPFNLYRRVTPKTSTKAHSSYHLSFLALAAFILLVDCYMTGLAWRYYLDFSWAVCFVCALLLYVNTGTEYESALDKFPSKTFATRRHFIAFVSISILLSAIFQFFGLFTTTRLSPAITIQPAAFFDVMSWFLAFN